MIAGHFGFAALVKSRAPRVPLSMLMLATVFLDFVFVPLTIAGIEPIEKVGNGGYGQLIIHADWDHSLVGALVISAIFGALCSLKWGKQSGAILGGVVFSHWLLDLPLHRGDMPILPWTREIFGFGLWRFPMVTAALELALVVIGGFLYMRAAMPHDPKRGRVTGIAAIATGIAVLALNVAGL